MHIVIVSMHVKPDKLSAFREATLDNVTNSLQELGIARFDFLQQSDVPSRFILVEAYQDEQAVARHKETAHYSRWREAVDSLMAEPRTRVVYENIHPGDSGWR